MRVSVEENNLVAAVVVIITVTHINLRTGIQANTKNQQPMIARQETADNSQKDNKK
jgi:hypothetical protein